MERYKSKCPDCGAEYQWTGFKTGIGKTPEQLEQMKKDETVCRECGGSNLQTGLGDDPELDSFLGGLLQMIVSGELKKKADAHYKEDKEKEDEGNKSG